MQKLNQFEDCNNIGQYCDISRRIVTEFWGSAGAIENVKVQGKKTAKYPTRRAN